METQLLKRPVALYEKMIDNAAREHFRVGFQSVNGDVSHPQLVYGPDVSENEKVRPDNGIQVPELEFEQELP